MKNWVWVAIGLVAAFLFGYWFRGKNVEIVETTRIDTLFYEKPTPISTSDVTVNVNVPKLIFAPADTVDRTIVVGDSVQITVTERTLEYRDSTYYARVVGPVVGPLGPRLDYFETYNTTKTTTQIIKQPRKVLSLAAIVGSDYAKYGWTPYAELGLSIDIRFATITATAGVDDVFKSPQLRIGAEMGIPIWSK